MDTITVQRSNVILDIKPEQKDYYLGQGYSVIDNKTGAVIEGSTVQTVESLNGQIAQLRKIIDKQDAEIRKLRKANRAKNKE